MNEFKTLDRVRLGAEKDFCMECGDMSNRTGRIDPYPGYPEGEQPSSVRAVRLLGCMRLHIVPVGKLLSLTPALPFNSHRYDTPGESGMP